MLEEQNQKHHWLKIGAIILTSFIVAFLAFYIALEMMMRKISDPMYNVKRIEKMMKTQEEAFRKLETEVTYKFSKLNNQVIATGGGVIKRPINLENLKQNGKIIFIDRPLDLLKPTTSRPLSNDPDKLRQLYSERYDIYMRNADLVIKNDEEFEECVHKLYHEVK